MNLSITITEDDFVKEPKLFDKLKNLLSLGNTDEKEEERQEKLTPRTTVSQDIMPAQTLTAPIQQPSVPAAPAASEAEYTLEQLALAGAALMDMEKTDALISLLNNTFGVASLQQLPKEKYNDFAVYLREMGARI